MSAVAFDRVSIALGHRAVLSDVSLTIAAGEFVGVLGPNGAGKTTMMRAILGLTSIAAGSITVLGAPPRRGNAAIGYVPQFRRTPLPPGITGEELLLSAHQGERWGLPLAGAAERAAVAEALSRVSATDIARRPLAHLSGGERQRLFIAQALVGRPKLLLLDEPLLSLDPVRQRAMVELVRQLARELDVAVLFSAHEINPLLGAIDKVLYLGGGHAAIGSVDEVVNDTVLTALYRSPVRVIRADGHIFVHSDVGVLDGHDPHDHHEHVH
jgi:zinc/manganese transport system ATP-binding protein